MWLLTAGMVGFGLLILGLYRLKRYVGLALLYCFVGAIQFLQNLLAATVFVDFMGRYPVSPGSAVLFSSTLFAVLLVYIREDVQTTRRLIYGVVVANATLALIAQSTQLALSWGALQSSPAAVEWFPFYPITAFLLGTTLLVADAFLVIVVYGVLAARAPWLGLWGRVVLALGGVLALDSVLFSKIAFRGMTGAGDFLLGNLTGKLLAGLVFGSLLWAYLSLARREDASVAREIMDPFSIFTYRERLEQLQEEKAEIQASAEKERRRAQFALEGAGLGLWEWSVQDGSTYLDDRWAAMLGYTKEEIVPQIGSWEARIHPDDRSTVEEAVEAHLGGRTPLCQVEHRLRTKSGDWKWILSLGKVVAWDEAGRPLRMSGTHLDIQERKAAEEALRQSEARLAEAQRIAGVGSWDLEVATGKQIWSEQMYSIWGRDRATFVPTTATFVETVHADDRPLLTSPLEASAPGERHYRYDYRILRPDGEVRFIHSEVRWEADADGNPLRLQGTSQDVTEIKRAERSLQKSQEQLRRLAASIEAARESERAAIAREVHDELGQALTGLKMDLTTLRPRLSERVEVERLDAMNALIDRTIQSVRDLSSRLRPSVLEDLGLCEAIEWQAGEFLRRTAVECRLSLDADCENLDPTVGMSVFRIFQEALTNVARHAEAKSVEISLQAEDSALFLTVKDDGKGIESDTLAAGDSLGLLGMRERAVALGGMLTVTRAKERGTLVSMSVPL